MSIRVGKESQTGRVRHLVCSFDMSDMKIWLSKCGRPKCTFKDKISMKIRKMPESVRIKKKIRKNQDDAFHVLTRIGQLKSDAHYALLISLLIIKSRTQTQIRKPNLWKIFTQFYPLQVIHKKISCKNLIFQRIGYLLPKIQIKWFPWEYIFQGS
jgi:hypothetical protein